MRIAKDGKPFDVDNLAYLPCGPAGVEIIQFLRPDGMRRRMLAEVGEELAKKAKNLIISAEELTTGEIAIYVRKVGEPEPEVNEAVEIAVNGSGDKSPNECLKRLIKRCVDQKEEEMGNKKKRQR